MASIVDSALDAAMGTLTQTHGVPVTVRYADNGTEFVVRGIYNAAGILSTMTSSGIPMESYEVQIGFRKSDFRRANMREPRAGDIVVVPDVGTFRVSRRPTDDGIELTVGVKDITDVGTSTTD